MTEEQKQKIMEMQRVRVTGCILFTQIYSSKEQETVRGVVSGHPEGLRQMVLDKVLATLMLHCFKSAKQEDMAAMIQNAQKGVFSLDGFLELSNVDIAPLGVDGADLGLGQEEKQLLAVLKDYEKKAQEQRQAQDTSDIEGNREDRKWIELVKVLNGLSCSFYSFFSQFFGWNLIFVIWVEVPFWGLI